MKLGLAAHKVKWFLLACLAVPMFVYRINLSVRFSKEVRDLKKMVRGYQDAYRLDCKFSGRKCHQKLRVRHVTYERMLSMGLMHDLIIEDRDFLLGTIRIIVDAERIETTPHFNYTKTYRVQNMHSQFEECESVADAISKLDTFKTA